MKENIIRIYSDNDNFKEYKVLVTIKKNYYYIVYTNLENDNIKENLSVIKLDSLKSNEPIPITDDEWAMIHEEYNKLIN